MNINLDFGDGLTREYTLSEELASSLLDGENVTFEFCHPVTGELFVAKKSAAEMMLDEDGNRSIFDDVDSMSKREDFIAEMKTVMNKFGAKVHCVDSYNGNEEIVGCSYYIQIGKNQPLNDENNFSVDLDDLE